MVLSHQPNQFHVHDQDLMAKVVKKKSHQRSQKYMLPVNLLREALLQTNPIPEVVPQVFPEKLADHPLRVLKMIMWINMMMRKITGVLVAVLAEAEPQVKTTIEVTKTKVIVVSVEANLVKCCRIGLTLCCFLL